MSDTMQQQPKMVSDPTMAVGDHPAIMDVNAEHNARLTPVERFCKRIADATGSPTALFAAIIIQFAWVAVGQLSHWDPYPFAFLLTVSNIIQLILIFVIAVAQRQSSEHAELRAESDHDSIARLLHHQEVQEAILMRIALKTQADVADLKSAVDRLMQSAAGSRAA
ncbi:MAG: hypothetical protein PVSMB8_16870 [Vulcanimicrobiaceae bacterium]